MSTKSFTFFTAVFLASVLRVCADGFIVIPQPGPVAQGPRGSYPFAPLEVTYHKVECNIDDQMAVTSVDTRTGRSSRKTLPSVCMARSAAGESAP